MKILKTTIRLAVAMVILGCNNQTNPQPQDNNSKNETKGQERTVEQETNSFQKSLQFKNISFDINTKGSGSLRQLFIKCTGFEVNNQNFELEINGHVSDAQVADLNSDGFPELMIFTQSAGSGGYGDVIAFSANGEKSMSRVYFPPTNENPKLSEGYMGHDKFSIEKSTLIQEFPVYKKDDKNSNPTGGIRRIEYKLMDGEASRKFVADKISESTSRQ